MRRLSLLLIVPTAAALPAMLHAASRNGFPEPDPVPAAANPLCSSLSNVVYVQTGDTQVNLLKRLSRSLRDNVANPITLVWTPNGSCTNINAIYTDVKSTAVFEFAPSTAEDPAWNPATSATKKCDPDPGGQSLDIANSALFVSSCPSGPPPAGVTSSFGPIQAYVLAVPEASSINAISYEEAYFVFGFGQDGQIASYDDNFQIFTRPITKSTLLTWAANISVPAGKWVNTGTKCVPDAPTCPEKEKSSEVVNALKNSPAPEKAIGILGAEVYDGERASLNSLAFRAKGQKFAYYPDSTSTSRDKKNLRDGHYTVWSPTEWLQKVDGGNNPVNAKADYVIGLISGRAVTPAPNFDPNEHIAAVGLVPDCAMGVKRDFDGGDLRKYQPAESCACKYEALVDVSDCQSCAGGESCAIGVCRNGFCEVQ